MSKLTLDRLTDQATIDVEIGGRPYTFRELDVDALGRLQAEIKVLCPSPVAKIRPQLDGLPQKDRDRLLELAYRDAINWPPIVGTAAGAAALLGTEPGQVAVLHEGLRASNPGVTREEAASVYRQLQKDTARSAKAARLAGTESDGEGTANRIFRVLFDMDDPDDPSPKASAAATAASRSNGAYSSAPASSG